MINFEMLSKERHLGRLRKYTQIPGGRIHGMWKIETTTGNYAVKVLNASRVSAKDLLRYRQTEKIASLLAAHRVNAVSAIPFQGDVIYSQSGIHCMIYHWVEGPVLAALSPHDFAYQLGESLAYIHAVQLDYDPAFPSHTSYVNEEQDKERSWSFPTLNDELKNRLDALSTDIQHIEQQAKKIKSKPLSDQFDCVLSHRDMDPSNVIMNNNQLMIIDWELAGYIDPTYDFLLTALYTARIAPGKIDLDVFKKFTAGYTSIHPIPNPSNWEDAWVRVLDGWLEWLHFNVQRAVDVTKSQPERDLGRLEADKILKTIDSVYLLKPQWDLTQFSRSIYKPKL